MFTLDYPQACQDFYAQLSEGKSGMAERIADQLATICAMLGEYPAVRYRRWVTMSSYLCTDGISVVAIASQAKLLTLPKQFK